MSGSEPVTEAEAAALAAVGLAPSLLAPGDLGRAMDYYRAGFREGSSTPVDPRVFRVGDPEPGPEVVAVLDCDLDQWCRDDAPYWVHRGEWRKWADLLGWGPLVACAPLPDYRAVVEADGERRAAEAAGGAW